MPVILGTWRESELLIKIGRRIAAARIDAGMTQQELADRACIHRSSVANLERGNQEMAVTRLALLAQILGLKLEDLVR
jgi:transcriptional regulator with XRE-family HTH domain